MNTLLEKYETQRKLLKVRFYPCYIPTCQQELAVVVSKDVCTIDNSRREAKNCRQEDHIKKGYL